MKVRINEGRDEVPQIGEVVLIVGEEKNRGKWMKGRVLRYVTGKDGVIRGAMLHKGNHMERPSQLLCIEIRNRLCEAKVHNVSTEEVSEPQVNRKKRQAAKDAKQRIRECLQQDDEY